MLQRMNIPHVIVSIAKMYFKSWTLIVGLKFQLYKTTLNVVIVISVKVSRNFLFTRTFKNSIND